jgi:hypothetical protein
MAYSALIRAGMSSADDARMDDTPVPETLETIAEKITALGKSIDQRFEETKAQLGVKIEAVDAKVTLVYDAVISLQKQADTNARDARRA